MMRLSAAATLLLCSCVTQGTYDALRAEADETQAQLEARNKTLRDYEQSTAALKRDIEKLQAALDDSRGKITDLDARIARFEADRVSLVKDRSSLEASVAEMTAALAELQKRKEAADARLAEFRALLAKFKGLIDAGKLKVRIVEGRMVVVLNTDVLFPSGSANLSRDGKTAIAEVGSLLASIAERKFQVEGHTDNVPIATAQYPSNWELAASRALTVLKTMVDAGLPAARISAASFGDSKPSGANDSPEGRAANRRIEIIIVPDLSTLPGFDELNRVEKGA
ncbi:MAG: OmpA/MotB family protein [Myxococcaceae bacterium]